MADTKISVLPAVTTPGASDELAIVNGGDTKRVTIQNLVDAAVQKSILGSTAGNLIRVVQMAIIRDTSGADGIKCQITLVSGIGFNASANIDTTLSAIFAKSGSDTVGSGATETIFSLDASGTQITLNLVEAITNVLSHSIAFNSSGTELNMAIDVQSGNLRFIFRSNTGANFDVTSMTNGQRLTGKCAFVVGGAE